SRPEAEDGQQQGGEQSAFAEPLPPGRLHRPAHEQPNEKQQQPTADGRVQQPSREECPRCAHDFSRGLPLLLLFLRAAAIMACMLSSSSGGMRSVRSRLMTSWAAAPSKTRSKKRAALSSRLKRGVYTNVRPSTWCSTRAFFSMIRSSVCTVL